MKKNLIFLLIALSAIFVSCNKDVDMPQNPKPPTPEPKEVILHFDQGKGIINSNMTIYSEPGYHDTFLEPYEGPVIAKGIFTIKKAGIIVYESAAIENGTSYNYTNGTYTLRVAGNYEGTDYVKENITIIVGSVTPPPTTATWPIRLYNPRVVNNNFLVDVCASKHQWLQQSAGLQWFYVSRINGLNFIGNQAVTNFTDSVHFTLTMPAINSTYMEFCAGYADGSINGVWLIPALGNPPSVLYAGIGVPYSLSESFFGFRLHSVSGGWEIRTQNGALLLSTTAVQNPIPGNNGDGSMNNYQTRWSGFTQFFKTSIANPTLRYKVGNGEWIYVTPTQLANNPEYWFWYLPTTTAGKIFFQWGTGGATNFSTTESITEMSNSMYWDGTSLLSKIV